MNTCLVLYVSYSFNVSRLFYSPILSAFHAYIKVINCRRVFFWLFVDWLVNILFRIRCYHIYCFVVLNGLDQYSMVVVNDRETIVNLGFVLISIYQREMFATLRELMDPPAIRYMLLSFLVIDFTNEAFGLSNNISLSK